MRPSTVIFILMYLFSWNRAFADFWKFKENKGQLHHEILYISDIPGGQLLVRKNKLTYIFLEESFLNRQISHAGHKHTAPPPSRVKGHVIDVDFLHANINSQAIGLQAYPEKYNYYLGNNPDNFASEVAAYAELKIEEIYPGIDLVFYDNNGVPEYDFRLKPGADAAQINIRYSGADSLWIEKGDLHCKTSVNRFVEKYPVAWHNLPNGKPLPVKCNFKLKGNQMSFDLPEGYRRDKSLIIDPRLIFSTYSGIRHDNWGNTATFDEAGNTYSAGTVLDVIPQFLNYTPAPGALPITPGAFDVSYNGGSTDMAILKFNTTGNQLLYATYVGGRDTEIPSTMLVNANNELIVVGVTSSDNFPTTAGAFDRTFNGGIPVFPWGRSPQWFVEFLYFNFGSDLFVLKLNEAGSQLLASTYVGGTANDGLLYSPFDSLDRLCGNYGDQLRSDIALDAAGNVVVSSHTQSEDFPVTPGVFQPVYGGGMHDAVVFKLNADLDQMIFSTYYGMGDDDAAYSVKVDGADNVLIGGGSTGFLDFGTGTSLTNTPSGDVDGFIAKFSPDATQLLSGTFLGTAEYDQVYFIDVDAQENIYALGQTRGFYPTTATKFSNPNSGQFIHKLSPTLDSTYFAFTFGSGDSATTEVVPNLSPTAFLISECENIFVAGWGGETNIGFPAGGGFTDNMPLTPNATQSATDGSDFYLISILKDADSLLYGTYIGSAVGAGDHVDGGTSRFDKRGIVYHAVCACVDNSQFPTTPGAWSRINASYLTNPSATLCNNAVFKYDLSTLRADFEIYDRPGGRIVTAGCAPATVILSNTGEGGNEWSWQIGDSVISVSQDSVTITFPEPGTYLLKHYATDFSTCVRIDSMIKEFVVYEPGVVFPTDTALCFGDTIALSVFTPPAYTVEWAPDDYGFLSTGTHSALFFPTVDTTYFVRAFNPGCVYQDSFDIKVIPVISADFSMQLPGDTNRVDSLCVPETILLKNLSVFGEQFYWYVNDSLIAVLQDSVLFSPQTGGRYEIKLVAVDSLSCNVADSMVRMLDGFLPEPDFPGDTSVCFGELLELKVGNLQPTDNIRWRPGTLADDSVRANVSLSIVQDTVIGITVTDFFGCSAQDSLAVKVIPVISADFSMQLPGDTNRVDSLCVPETILLKNLSVFGEQFYWYANDSLIAVLQDSVYFSPQKGGRYEIKLVAVDSLSCNVADSLVRMLDGFLPEPDFPGDTSVCFGELLELSIGNLKPGEVAVWTPGTLTNDSTAARAAFTIRLDTVIRVTVSDILACSVSDSLKVRVIPVVKADFDILSLNDGNEIAVDCAPSQLMLKNLSVFGEQFYWSINDSLISRAQDSVPQTVSDPGLYSIVLWTVDSLSCNVVDSAVKTFGALRPQPVFPHDTILCIGDTLQAQVGNLQYFESAFWLNTAGDTLFSGIQIRPVFSTDIRLTVAVSDTLGCTATASFSATYLPYLKADFSIIDPDAGGGGAITHKCLPGNVLLVNKSIQGEYFYWFFNDSLIANTEGPIPVVPNRRGNFMFHLEVHDSLTCNKSDKSTQPLAVSRPQVKAPADTSVCVNTTLSTQVTGLSSGDKVKWSPSLGLSNDQTGEVIITSPFASRYTIVVHDSGGCYTTVFFNLEAISIDISAAFSVQNALGQPLAPVDGCSPLDLIFVNQSQSYDVLEWSTGDGFAKWETSSAQQTKWPYTYRYPGVYEALLRVTDTVCNQTRAARMPVKVRGPQVVFPPDTTICFQDSVRMVLDTDEAYTVSWFPDRLISAINSKSPWLYYGLKRDYYVYVSDSMNCYVSDTITVSPLPRIELIDDTLFFCKRDDYTLDLNATEGLTGYLWQPGNVAGAVMTADDTGRYYVQAYDEHGCRQRDTTNLFDVCLPKIFVPSVFTPNNDGINDKFEIFGSYILSFELKIFNRWGELIFYSDKLKNFWDATYKGNEVPIGVYTWVITYGGEGLQGTVSETIRGDVSVVR